MRNDERLLLRHLAWVLVIKLLALTALWWFFVRDARTSPDEAVTAQHLAAPTQASGGPQ